MCTVVRPGGKIIIRDHKRGSFANFLTVIRSSDEWALWAELWRRTVNAIIAGARERHDYYSTTIFASFVKSCGVIVGRGRKFYRTFTGARVYVSSFRRWN